MNILHNPVFRKELLLRVRSWRFAVTIIIYNGILALITLFVFFMAFGVNVAANGNVDYAAALTMYGTLAGFQFALVLFMVPIFTAGSIAGERERQTLDILLTTKMRPIQIVIGKLMSSIVMVILLSISSIPIIAIVFSIGGVTMKDLLQLELLVIVTALYVGSMGVLGSALFKKTMVAIVFAYAGSVALCGVAYALLMVMYAFQMYSSVVPGFHNADLGVFLLLLLTSPIFSIICMLSNQFGASFAMDYVMSSLGTLPDVIMDNWFSLSMIVQLALTVVFILLAANRLDPLRKRKSRRRDRKFEPALAEGAENA